MAEAPAEQELREREFFARVRLRNGVFKTTWARRFDDLNDRVLRLLPVERPLELMDVAVSSGISTLEWVESLREAGIAHRMVAGDAAVRASLISIGPIEALVDGEGHPLHFDVLGRGIPTGGEQPIYRLITGALQAGFGAALRLVPSLRRTVGEGGVLAGRFARCTPIELISPRLRAVPEIEVVEDDVLSDRDSSLARRFHVVRAANILNRGYFDDVTLGRAVENLRGRLREGGLFIVCRTVAATNHATIFRSHGGRLAIADRLGEGSEIESLVLRTD
jgi:hypothetical protein